MATAGANQSPAGAAGRETTALTPRSRGMMARAREVVERPSYANILATVTLLCTVSYFILSLSASKNGIHAQLFSNVYSEYSAPHMSDCIAELENFLAKTGPENYASAFMTETRSRSELGRKLDHSRRHVQAWFAKIAHLHEFDLLEDRFLQAFPGSYRAARFLRLVEPLAQAVADQHQHAVAPVFNYYRNFYNLPKLERIIQMYAHDEL